MHEIMRTRRRRGLLAALLPFLVLVPACTRRATGSTAALTPADPEPTPDAAAVLERACTVCHDLGGLSAYSGSWGEEEWRSMVETMVSYGARVSPAEIDLLAAYLGTEYGTDAGSGGPQ